MDKESFIGLPFLLATLSQMNMLSIMKGNGGEDCLMVLEYTKKSMGIYIQEYSKMGLNREKVLNYTETGIFTKDNTLMGCHKAMESTLGKMEAHSRETSSKE